jgi:hypothetical protein
MPFYPHAKPYVDKGNKVKLTNNVNIYTLTILNNFVFLNKFFCNIYTVPLCRKNH